MVEKLFWKNKNVLVTGHTGFKGSWLCLWLQSLGAKVSGFALVPNTEPNLFELASVSENMHSYIGDIREYDTVEHLIKQVKPEIIIHMAAQPLVRYSYENPIETYSTNVMGTVNLLNLASQCDSVKAVVNVTTDKCYENQEWVWGYREDDPMGGHDPYSSSKGCAELVTSAYRKSFYLVAGKGLASARAGNVVGGGDWSQDRLIVDIMNAITQGSEINIRNPNAIRPWQHVLEPLSGYLRLVQKLYTQPEEYSQAWNFGPYTEDAATVENVTNKILSVWGDNKLNWQTTSDVNSVHEANFLKLDINKVQRFLQWKPTLSLDRTLQWVVAWYQAWKKNENMQEISLGQIKDFEKEQVCND